MRVAIVGGGVAGSYAAMLLAEHGFDVTLFEWRRGYVKPCGEAVPVQLWGRVGGFARDVAAVKSVVFYYKPGPSVTLSKRVEARLLGYTLDKAWMVESIREAAEAAGARLVYRRAEPESIMREYDVVVDARGPYSDAPEYDSLVAARWYVRRCSLCEEEAAVFVFGRFPGYAWAFPRPWGWNVGIGFRAAWARRWRLTLDDLLRMASRLLGFEPGSARGGAAAKIKLSVPAAVAMGGRLYRIGEAGGFIVPYSGEGIRPAVESAEALVESLARGSDEPLRRLERLYGRLHRFYRAARLLGDSRLGALAYAMLGDRLVKTGAVDRLGVLDALRGLAYLAECLLEHRC